MVGAYNAAQKRHPEKHWPPLNWFDLLKDVIRAEPVVVKGALNFGLKSLAGALHDLGLVATTWKKTEGPADGLGAMAAAWWCDNEASMQDCRMTDLPLFREIEDYNFVDCRAVSEILRYLRTTH